MSQVPKITKYNRLPELLKYKQEAEEKTRNRDDRRKPPFSREDEEAINPASINEYKVSSPKETPLPRTDREGVGENIDLKI